MSEPRKHYRPDIARRTRDISRFGLATCAECGKRAFVSKRAAKGAARVQFPGQRMRVYQCGEWWHMTSQDAARTEQMRDHYAGSPDEPAA